jgi:exopolyphosphatase/guanosine-5'-triphosphate,3'-diphosphate pyrophosphatase
MSHGRFAFIDIGTNTILCLIADLKEDHRFRVVDDLAEITRLGRGVDRTGRIGAEGEQRSLEVLRRYLKRCKSLNVEGVMAVGTSALRDAQNSAEVQARIQTELGLVVRVISGEEEAAYSFLAVRSGLHLPGREVLVIDIGGGSTEFIRGNDAGVLQAVSLNLGSVRLTEQFLHSDPVRGEECEKMIRVIDQELAGLVNQWQTHNSALTLVGIAGTFTTLAAVEKKLLRYSHSEFHGRALTVAEVRRQVELFRSRTIAARKAIPGLEPKRADVILAGACLIERIMTLIDAEQVVVSDQGVRYGLLHERLRQRKNC